VQTYINAGSASVTDQFHHRTIGFNYRLGEFQAALLSAQLESLPQQAVIRMANMAYFEQQLAKTPGIGFLKAEPRITTLAPYGFVLKYFSEQVNDIPRAAFVALCNWRAYPAMACSMSRCIAAPCSRSIPPTSPR
jgi:dTDP-4-amino-4,6-dideoxygalactose transaminase